MAAWTAAARQATNMARLSSPKSASTAQASSLVPRRGLAGGGGELLGGPNPMHPSKWKQEHFAIVSFAGCGALLYGGYKFYTEGKKGQEGRES